MIENQVILDPARKDGSWSVVFDGCIVAAGYNSKGAAQAALGLYVSGYRKPREMNTAGAARLSGDASNRETIETSEGEGR
jgi:hypothetical protein